MDDADVKSLPPWKSNDVKVRISVVYYDNPIKKIKSFFFCYHFQSWIWMQQAMHPELNYNGYFKKRWVRMS